MEKNYEWMKVVYRDEDGKKTHTKWAKVPLQGNARIDQEMREGIAEMMQPKISWEIEETCMTKPNMKKD